MILGRKGTSTIAKTSVPDILIDLIDAIRNKDYNEAHLTPRKESRTNVIIEATTLLAYKIGILEDFLKKNNYSETHISNIVERLKKY